MNTTLVPSVQAGDIADHPGTYERTRFGVGLRVNRHVSSKHVRVHPNLQVKTGGSSCRDEEAAVPGKRKGASVREPASVPAPRAILRPTSPAVATALLPQGPGIPTGTSPTLLGTGGIAFVTTKSKVQLTRWPVNHLDLTAYPPVDPVTQCHRRSLGQHLHSELFHSGIISCIRERWRFLGLPCAQDVEQSRGAVPHQV